MAFIDSRMVNGPDGKNVFDSLNDHASSLADNAKKEINILTYKNLVNIDDWTPAFNQAQIDCPVGGKIVFPKDTYKGEFNITKSLDVDFRGSKLVPTGLDKNIINIIGSRSSNNYVLSSNRVRGQKDLPLVSSPTDITVGDLIVLRDDTTRPGDALPDINIEVHRVKAINGNTVTIEDFIRLPKSVAATSNVYKINTIKDINLENLVCEGLTGATVGGGINTQYVENVAVRNFKMTKNLGATVTFRTSFNCTVDGFDVSSPIASAGGQGYGIAASRGTNGFYVRNGKANAMRHAVDCSETFGALVENIVATGSVSTAFVLSHNSYGSDVKFKDCKAYDCVSYGFQISNQGAADLKTAIHHNMHLERCEVEFVDFTDPSSYAIGVSYECPVKNSTIDVSIRKGDGNTKPTSSAFSKLDGVRTTSNANDLKIRLRARGLINATLFDIGDFTAVDKETDSIMLDDVIIENCTNAIRYKNVYSLSVRNLKIKNVDTLLFNFYDAAQLKLRYFNLEDVLLDGYTTFTSYDFSTIAHANGIMGKVSNIRNSSTTNSGSITVTADKAFTMEEILTSRHGETLKLVASGALSLNANPLPSGWFIGQKVALYSQSGNNITIPKGSNMFTYGATSVILGINSLRSVVFEWNGTVWMQLGGVPAAATSIAVAPLFVGQLAVVSGIGYIATGTSASTDWKQIS